jgi:hypothetical protein
VQSAGPLFSRQNSCDRRLLSDPIPLKTVQTIDREKPARTMNSSTAELLGRYR